MKIKSADILQAANLAKLHVENKQVEGLRQDIGNTLELINRMDRVDTSDIKPLAHPLDTAQPLRADDVTEANQRELFLSLAPETMAGLFIVPQVIETE